MDAATKKLIERVAAGDDLQLALNAVLNESTNKPARLTEGMRSYTVAVIEHKEGDWEAVFAIPELHNFQLKEKGRYGWEALAKLADRAKRTGVME